MAYLLLEREQQAYDLLESAQRHAHVHKTTIDQAIDYLVIRNLKKPTVGTSLIAWADRGAQAKKLNKQKS